MVTNCKCCPLLQWRLTFTGSDEAICGAGFYIKEYSDYQDGRAISDNCGLVRIEFFNTPAYLPDRG